MGEITRKQNQLPAKDETEALPDPQKHPSLHSNRAGAAAVKAAAGTCSNSENLQNQRAARQVGNATCWQTSAKGIDREKDRK